MPSLPVTLSVVVVVLLLSSPQASANQADGLPPLSYVINPLALWYFDLALRDVRTLYGNETWCTFDGERQEWCGGNYTNPWNYCVVAPTSWPPTNVTEWLFSTDMAGFTQTYPGLPHPSTSNPPAPTTFICACVGNSSAAYYIAAPLSPVPRYQPPCVAEHGMFAMYMVIGVVFVFIVILSSLELIMWILMFVVKEKQCNILGGFLPKVFVWITAILVTNDIWVILAGSNGTIQWQLGSIWLWIILGMALISAYLWWLVVFVDVVIKTKKMSRETSLFTHTSKWLVVLLVTLCMMGFIGSMGAAYNFANRIMISENFLEIESMLAGVGQAEKANIILGCAMVFFALLYGFIFVIYSSLLILRGSESGMAAWETLKVKTLWNISATVCLALALGCLIAYACYCQWFLVQMSQYQNNMAWMWIWIIQVYFGAGMLISITLALKTQFAEGENYFTSICRNAKTIESSSRGAKSKGSMKAGSTKTSGNSIA